VNVIKESKHKLLTRDCSNFLPKLPGDQTVVKCW